MSRVVVTGLGPVSSIGIGIAEFGRSLREGRAGTSPIRCFDTTGFPHVYAGEVHEFRPEDVLRRLDVSAWGRSALFAACAARLAVEDAGLEPGAVSPDRIGVAIGTTCGETRPLETLTAEVVRDGFEATPAELAGQVGAHRLAHAASEEIGAAGESVTIATACSASNHAIGYAYDVLAEGEADVMVAGGAESVCRFVHAGFYRLGVLAETTCAPFDRDRTGILTAEGGAALVLETLDGALARGARPYAEVLGYAFNCDADHMVAAKPAHIAACTRLAHASAAVAPSEIDYISAHGTGTPANDAAESEAIREVFGEELPPVSSIKSMIGHAMGAASAFGAISSVVAISEGFIPPTLHWSTPDPVLGPIDPVPNEARPADVRVVQNNGFGFGGNNAVLILKAFE